MPTSANGSRGRRRTKKAEPIKVIATNRKATHDFTIHERIEAGVQLVGSEVKSLRDARVVISDGFVEFRKGQAYLHKVQINEYSQANRWGHDIERVRKLLLHKHGIDKLATKVREGLHADPAVVYFKGHRVKAELALVTHKKLTTSARRRRKPTTSARWTARRRPTRVGLAGIRHTRRRENAKIGGRACARGWLSLQKRLGALASQVASATGPGAGPRSGQSFFAT